MRPNVRAASTGLALSTRAHHLMLLPDTKLIRRKVSRVELHAKMTRSVLASR